jgi:hypothetical protein
MLYACSDNKVERLTQEDGVRRIRSGAESLGFFHATFRPLGDADFMDYVDAVISDGTVRAIVSKKGVEVEVLFYAPKKYKRIRTKNNLLKVFLANNELRILEMDSADKARNIRKVLLSKQKFSLMIL